MSSTAVSRHSLVLRCGGPRRGAAVIRAVLFDLDGTLLDIDLGVFLSDYFAALGPVLSGLTGLTEPGSLEALNDATRAMLAGHAGQTNEAVFNERFLRTTGTDLAERSARERVSEFYRTEFPKLKHEHGPRAGAAEAVDAARSAGLKVALATNPIFPCAAVLERLAWTGIPRDAFDVVTSYENCDACKPQERYFTAIAEALGVSPLECLMVGDDAQLDLPAARSGMQTYYVGPETVAVDGRHGTLFELARQLLGVVL